jgi:peptide/nickel transport system substrate-binding protein
MLRKVLLIVIMVVVGICLAAIAETSSGNIIRLDAAQQIGSIDPARHTTFWTELVALLNLYDALYYPGENGELQPQIAESYELSEDALTYTFALEKGIKFHDGTEVTAEDVAYSLKRQLAIGEGISWMWNAVEDVTVIDKYHVAIQLSAPGAERAQRR